jgi:hypothetical protein
VAKPHYEDVFCLGQHVLMDTGSCMIKSAGAAMPIDPPPPIPVVKASTAGKPTAPVKRSTKKQ